MVVGLDDMVSHAFGIFYFGVAYLPFSTSYRVVD
jgi:hypothetical protein